MTKRPADDDILLAAEWLDCNEGDPNEREPMRRVAEWLRETVTRDQYRRTTDKAVREIAKKAGVSKAQAREKLRSLYTQAQNVKLQG